MLTAIDLETLTFSEPLYLWLLGVPALMSLLWSWQLIRRRRDTKHFQRQRLLPVRERYALAGDLAFWLCLLVAAGLCIVALARPRASITTVRQAGADFVVLQDGSSSMYVDDVEPDRWQRSTRFLRVFFESLSWKDDRVALALFARLPAPQVRLTSDPNALFFFLDHLGERSPFRLEDLNTWDTNIEEGVYWGLKMIDKDEELFGGNSNPKAFIVISDGQAWSGDVAASLALARQRDIPVHVVGVGTARGGLIPESVGDGETTLAGYSGQRRMSDIRAVLDRDSLRTIARAGGGEYFELGRDSDRDIAFRIISSVRSRAPAAQQEETFDELYWRFLFLAAIFLGLGALLLKKPAELLWQAAAAVAVILFLSGL